MNMKAKELFKELGFEQIHDYDEYMKDEEGNIIVYMRNNGSQIWFYEKTKTYYVENWNNRPLPVDVDLAKAIMIQLDELGWI